MSISSVSTAPVIVPLDAGSPKSQDAMAATSGDTTTDRQPPPPLPPGQGTRVDQLG